MARKLENIEYIDACEYKNNNDEYICDKEIHNFEKYCREHEQKKCKHQYIKENSNYLDSNDVFKFIIYCECCKCYKRKNKIRIEIDFKPILSLLNNQEDVEEFKKLIEEFVKKRGK